MEGERNTFATYLEKNTEHFSTYLSTSLPAAMRSVEFDNEIFFSRAEASMADVRT
jgi:hypothetical protein